MLFAPGGPAIPVATQERARRTRQDKKTGLQPNQSFTMADDATSSVGTDAGTKETNTSKAVIKNVDMSEEMQQTSIDIAVAALEQFAIEKDIASQVKREFDKKFGPTWHVVVGKNFGSYVTHETKHFIYFYIGPLAFLIWKS